MKLSTKPVTTSQLPQITKAHSSPRLSCLRAARYPPKASANNAASSSQAISLPISAVNNRCSPARPPKAAKPEPSPLQLLTSLRWPMMRFNPL